MKRILLLCFGLLSLGACAQTEEYTSELKNEDFNLTTETLFSDRESSIWGFEFLPNNDIIFTERDGKIGIFSNGDIKEIKGFPAVAYESQGGLLDIALHPDYKNNGWIYATYLENTAKDAKMNLVRFKIVEDAIGNLENIHSTSATNKWKGHNGSRIVFDNDGYLFWSVGEGGPSSRGGKDSPNQNAQNVKEGWGKIHRMNDDGSVPADNPILPGNTAPTTVYTYGNRNPQGLTLNPETNEIWETEHGPKGGDELNLVKKGANYGWPWVSYGVNYDGKDISGKKHTGFEEPIFQWTPSIAACGLAYLNSDIYGEWKGSFLAGALAFTQVSRMFFEGGKVKEEVLLKGIGRVRDVLVGPDGYIYLSLEGPGRIVKVVPVKK